MPIEIKELHIRINVEERPQASGNSTFGQREREALFAECVEQVMNILSVKEER